MIGQAVILAAGLGTRLGRPFPKPLTQLNTGEAILVRQVRLLRDVFPGIRVMIVVGFKADLILEAVPDACFAYNETFDQSNTAVSLRKALTLCADDDVLWLNGDVVFDAALLERVAAEAGKGRNLVCVNQAAVGEEEVKYSLDDSGRIAEISKSVTDPHGEAIGINLISSHDREALIRALHRASDNDYFERGIELAIEADNLHFQPVDVSDRLAIEVDFGEDLERANQELSESS